MSKALLVTLEYPPQIGGVAHFYHELVEHSAGNIAVLDNSNNQLTPWWKSFAVIYRTIQREQPHSIIVGQVLPLGTVIMLLGWFTHKPYSVFIHGMDITVPQNYWRKRVLLRWILRRAKTIITISKYTQSKIEQLLPKDQHTKITIISPGAFITPEFRIEHVENVPNNYILSVGRLVERKGFDIALRAFAQVAHIYPELHYVIVGNGPEQSKLEQFIKDNHLEDRVLIYNNLTHEHVAYLYSRCEFLVAPSRVLPNGDFEGFGITVLEANSFGKPAIVGEGGMSDAVIGGETGLLVNLVTVETVKVALEQLLAQRDYTLQLGNQAKIWVEEKHSWEKKITTLKKLL